MARKETRSGGENPDGDELLPDDRTATSLMSMASLDKDTVQCLRLSTPYTETTPGCVVYRPQKGGSASTLPSCSAVMIANSA
ncbi:hypothetical protein GCM10007920_28710 [Ciceribacter naphthalenivorans]|uniref:Uncharacterized protein n=1 Tax=Sphingomonas psychrolutea TaxID=1259676 RepID=A0ABQ6EE44_9SPHN|nr:hypothetical protein GCM10007920_28710 [Ciceribacter naphthalenivorans]GLT05939.1 hypothetical protein GCM10007926_28710 [Sphingomonas psychrolutea]